MTNKFFRDTRRRQTLASSAVTALVSLGRKIKPTNKMINTIMKGDTSQINVSRCDLLTVCL